MCLFRSLADVNLSSILGDQVAVERERQAAGAAAGAISTMLVAEVTRAESLNYGVAVVDEHTRQVMHFVEKPSTFVASTISCGVYLFSPAIFEQIKGVYERHLGMYCSTAARLSICLSSHIIFHFVHFFQNRVVVSCILAFTLLAFSFNLKIIINECFFGFVMLS